MLISTDQLLEIKEILIKLKDELENDIEGLKESSQPVELDQQAFGRVSRVDAIQQQQIQASARRRKELKLQMVNAAIEKIQNNPDLFGMCGECEEPISFERLKVRPESIMCVNCANNKDSN